MQLKTKQCLKSIWWLKQCKLVMNKTTNKDILWLQGKLALSKAALIYLNLSERVYNFWTFLKLYKQTCIEFIALFEFFFNCSEHRTEILFILVFDSAKIMLTIFMNSSKESNPGTPGYSANIGLISDTSFWGFNFVQSIFWVPLFPLPHLKIKKIYR